MESKDIITSLVSKCNDDQNHLEKIYFKETITEDEIKIEIGKSKQNSIISKNLFNHAHIVAFGKEGVIEHTYSALLVNFVRTFILNA